MNDYEFIIKKYYLHWDETFWGSLKQRPKAYAQEDNIIPLEKLTAKAQ